MADELVERDQLVDSLRGALADGRSGLSYVPRLLRRVLETGAWRERYDAKTRAVVRFRSFGEFVGAQPTEGLGTTMELVNRIVGTNDPGLLRLLREARKGQPGRPKRETKKGEESTPISKGEDSTLTADRLAREAPAEYAAVMGGQKTIHAAALAAGIRKRRVSVRMDDAESAARSLRKHMSPEDLARLAKLLDE